MRSYPLRKRHQGALQEQRKGIARPGAKSLDMRKAVSPVVTSGCPKRSEGGSPVGTRAYTAFRLTRRDNSPCAGRKIVYNSAARRAVCPA